MQFDTPANATRIPGVNSYPASPITQEHSSENQTRRLSHVPTRFPFATMVSSVDGSMMIRRQAVTQPSPALGRYPISRPGGNTSRAEQPQGGSVGSTSTTSPHFDTYLLNHRGRARSRCGQDYESATTTPKPQSGSQFHSSQNLSDYRVSQPRPKVQQQTPAAAATQNTGSYRKATDNPNTASKSRGANSPNLERNNQSDHRTARSPSSDPRVEALEHIVRQLTAAVDERVQECRQWRSWHERYQSHERELNRLQHMVPHLMKENERLSSMYVEQSRRLQSKEDECSRTSAQLRQAEMQLRVVSQTSQEQQSQIFELQQLILMMNQEQEEQARHLQTDRTGDLRPHRIPDANADTDHTSADVSGIGSETTWGAQQQSEAIVRVNSVPGRSAARCTTALDELRTQAPARASTEVPQPTATGKMPTEDARSVAKEVPVTMRNPDMGGSQSVNVEPDTSTSHHVVEESLSSFLSSKGRGNVQFSQLPLLLTTKKERENGIFGDDLSETSSLSSLLCDKICPEDSLFKPVGGGDKTEEAVSDRTGSAGRATTSTDTTGETTQTSGKGHLCSKEIYLTGVEVNGTLTGLSQVNSPVLDKATETTNPPDGTPPLRTSSGKGNACHVAQKLSGTKDKAPTMSLRQKLVSRSLSPLRFLRSNASSRQLVTNSKAADNAPSSLPIRAAERTPSSSSAQRPPYKKSASAQWHAFDLSPPNSENEISIEKLCLAAAAGAAATPEDTGTLRVTAKALPESASRRRNSLLVLSPPENKTPGLSPKMYPANILVMSKSSAGKEKRDQCDSSNQEDTTGEEPTESTLVLHDSWRSSIGIPRNKPVGPEEQDGEMEEGGENPGCNRRSHVLLRSNSWESTTSSITYWSNPENRLEI
jgi:hypothetical protein